MSIDSDRPPLSVRVLGPLELAVDGVAVEVPGRKRRAVLALLALAESATLSVYELIDALWPADPPANARAALHSHVSRLRAHLGRLGARLDGDQGGYRLRVEHGEFDVHSARDGLAEARRVAERDPPSAVRRLEAVRALWRGRPLAELAEVQAIAARVVGLADLRREVDELLVRCRLASGDTAGALHAAAAALAEDPFAEPAARQLMEALTVAGRTTEALQVGADLRRRLQEEYGVDPSPALVALERAIAAGATDPIGAPAPARSHPPAHSTAHGRVPVPVTSMVGRQSEVAALRRLVAGERLVSIVGPGGVGKTRLAVDVARRHDGDVCFIPLASVSDADAVPHALAAALGLEAVRGDVLEACARLLSAGPRLVVLDNCEHLLDRVREVVTTLLRRCPDLNLLTTSRRRLALAPECAFRVGPLAVPDLAAARPEQSPAVAVFLDRARRARPDFETDGADLAVVAEVVRRLDGMPLAIELAAGRLASLGVAELRDRLNRSLDLLRRGGSSTDDRHQTLRATAAWSFELLPAGQQAVWRNLAVFPDGVDLATAERIGADLASDQDPAGALAELVDASMLEADVDDFGDSRFRMLEPLRSFALEQLEAADELATAEERLVHWAVDLTAWVDATLHTDAEAIADAQLRRELPNLRAAWRMAMSRRALDSAIEIAVALDDAAQWRELPEVWRWVRQLADDPALGEHPRAAAALATASDFAWLEGELLGARRLADAALAHAVDDEGRWRALLASSVAHLSAGEFAAAVSDALESATRSPRPVHARLVAALGAAYAGDLDQAEKIARAMGPPAGITAQAEHEYTLGEIANIDGRHDRAAAHYRQAVDLARRVGSTFVVGIASVGLLTVHRAAGSHAEALRGYRDVIAYWEQAGNWIQAWATLRDLAGLLDDLGDTETALYLRTAADRAPDAPGVGNSTWAQRNHGTTPAVEPGVAATVSARAATASRTETVAIARRAIQRHLDAP